MLRICVKRHQLKQVVSLFRSFSTKEELEKNRAEWGIKYNDECLKFEKEWEVIANKVEADQAVFLSTELGDLQKEKVHLLVDKVLSLNMFEL